MSDDQVAKLGLSGSAWHVGTTALVLSTLGSSFAAFPRSLDII